MKEHAIVWVDTDGEWKAEGFEFEEEALEFGEGLTESGLPATYLTKKRLMGEVEDL